MVEERRLYNVGFASRAAAALAIALLIAACDNSKEAGSGAAQGGDLHAAKGQLAPFGVLINSSPLFESQQGWSSGYTRAIGHGRGVVVGPGAENPNVFAQQFPAKPGEMFKVIARASSAGTASAKGRIQINWTDSIGQFISVSSQAFEVKPEEQRFELEVVAPPKTQNGTLYVVPDGQQSVVRYTEMSLFGREKSSASGGNATVAHSARSGGEPNSVPVATVNFAMRI